MPSFTRNGGSGVLGSIKNRLGFGRDDNRYDDYGDYDEDYDAYSDSYDDYGTYDDDQADDGDMDRYGEVVERDASARRSRRSYTDVASSDFNERRYGSGSFTPLVSIDDIRANTQRGEADSPVGVRSSSLTRHEFRSSDYMASGSIEQEFIAEGHGSSNGSEEPKRASGYDALFSSTSTTPRQDDVAVGASPSESASSTRSSRSLVVLSPREYGEVEKVSRSLKSGDAVVLDLKAVPADLSKRVLDFSFGVASALDANVDCIGDKAFAITRYAQLSDAETMRLRGQGIL